METSSNAQTQIIFVKIVGNPLLSERDGNKNSVQRVAIQYWAKSETHYSLKEMETFLSSFGRTLLYRLSETHYSLKEMETTSKLLKNCFHVTFVGNPLLSERDGNNHLLLW